MRKITLLGMLALCSLASTAQSQTLEEGWYKLSGTSGTTFAGKVILNAEEEYRQATNSITGGPLYYALKYNDYNADKAPTAWFHIKNLSGNTYQVQGLNGHVVSQYCSALRYGESTGESTITAVTDTQLKIQYWSNFTTGSAEDPYVGRSSGANNLLDYERISDETLAGYDMYTVSITGAPTVEVEVGQDASLTCTNTENKGIAKVYDHGYFFFPQGTTVSTGDFTPSAVEDYRTEVAIENNTITVTYILKVAEVLQEAIDEAEAVIAKTGIGYPMADSDARTTLQAAIDAAKAAQAAPAESDITTLEAAIATYKSNTDDIQMPEDGKVYTLTFRPTNVASGTYRYINFTGTGLATVATTLDAELPETAKFVCHKWMDGTTAKYVLVPAYGNVGGKYLTYQTVTDAYTVGVNDFTVGTMVGKTANITDTSADNLFGYVYLAFTRRSSSNSQAGVYIMQESNGTFNNTTAPFLDGSYTSAIIMREVEGYPNTVALNPATGIDGIETVGTFSAPYAAIVPEGVTAYYVATADEGKEIAWMEPLEEGKAIPANTGVLLTSTDASVSSALMVPATAEEQAEVSGNLLGHSAGADKEIPAEEAAYVLTGVNGVVGFYHVGTEGRTLKMNKAYLVAPETAGETNAFSLKIGFDEETSINRVAVDGEDSQAPVYDLLGRRVAETPKSGIYIRNGKKFIVK